MQQKGYRVGFIYRGTVALSNLVVCPRSHVSVDSTSFNEGEREELHDEEHALGAVTTKLLFLVKGIALFNIPYILASCILTDLLGVNVVLCGDVFLDVSCSGLVAVHLAHIMQECAKAESIIKMRRKHVRVIDAVQLLGYLIDVEAVLTKPTVVCTVKFGAGWGREKVGFLYQVSLERFSVPVTCVKVKVGQEILLLFIRFGGFQLFTPLPS